LALLTLTPHIACLAALSFAIEVWGTSLGTMMIDYVLVLYSSCGERHGG
jgi:hypothetical protein